MFATATPSPFHAAAGYEITVTGGAPPYTFTPVGSPPNPPGVVVTSIGPPAHIDVPDDTPSGTIVVIRVTDSSTPPQTVAISNHVA